MNQTKATAVWGTRIIGTKKYLKSKISLLGVSMDSTAVAIEQDAVFGLEQAAEAQVAVLVPANIPEKAVSSEASDFELCRLATDGNLAAFEIIYQRYHRRTYALCLRMTNSQTEAEDLTQEVFIQLFRKVGSFRGDSAFSTWLHRLTVNQVLMYFRRRSVKNEKVSDDGEMPEQMVHGSANPNRMQVVDRIAIKNAVAQLPNGYKSVFMLHDVEGYEHEEVARRLGISIGTSKSQLHKARLKLRMLLMKQSG